MNEQQTPDREKKIAEIREALEKATPGPWKLVMDSYDDEKDTYFPWMIINADGEEICDFSGGGDVKLENAHIMTNASEWLWFLLDELERLKRDKLIKLLDMIKDDADRFGELVGIDVSETSLEEKGKAFNRKIETLQEERDKLIEGLRWYADAVNYEYRTSYLDQDAPIIDDSGQRARDILKEIGVTVEPDRLHDARVKIAKARFSPERLVGESAVYGIDCRSGRCEF